MRGTHLLDVWGDTDKTEWHKCLYLLATKTQLAGIETHKHIIHLLKYISGKYIDNFDLDDEGEYWPTMDEQLLRNAFARYGSGLDAIETS